MSRWINVSFNNISVILRRWKGEKERVRCNEVPWSQELKSISTTHLPVGIWRLYNVVFTSMQHHDLASMLKWGCINAMWPLDWDIAIRSQDPRITKTRLSKYVENFTSKNWKIFR